MKKILKSNVSKLYAIYVLFLAMLILISYSSYAMFTVTKEKNKAISLTTGSLNYLLTGNKLVNSQVEIESFSSIEIDVEMESLNSFETVYQLYFLENANISIEYKNTSELPYGTIGPANVKKNITLFITNKADTNQVITLGVAGGLPDRKLMLESDKTAINKELTLPVMKTYMIDPDENIFSNEDYHAEEYRTKITSVITKTNILVPVDNIKSWDISESKNGSVVAYLENDLNGGYKLVIGGKGGIILNADAQGFFYGFTSAINMDLSHFDTTRVTTMKKFFQDCSKLENVNISSFDTKNVASMRFMFESCSNLKTIDISHFNSSKVIEMNGMFFNCSALESIHFGESFSTENCTSVRYIFSGCSKLTNLDLTTFNTTTITDMSGMFRDCTSLKSILVSNKWTTVGKTITNMFQGCAISKVTVV